VQGKRKPQKFGRPFLALGPLSSSGYIIFEFFSNIILVWVVKKFRIFGKILVMLEQITGEVVTDDQDKDKDQPIPKGYARNEMGKLVLKSKLAKDQQAFVDAMQDQYKNRPEVIAAAKAKASKLKAMQSQPK
jgi:hypothetical protein